MAADDVPPALSQDNLFTAARRLVRFVNGDDAAHGGLLSLDTIGAAGMCERHLINEEKRMRAEWAARKEAQS